MVSKTDNEIDNTKEKDENAAQKGLRIAIDGPSGVGKSSTSMKLAQKLGYSRVDSGQLYRCITHIILQESFSETTIKTSLITDEIIMKNKELLESIQLKNDETFMTFSYQKSNGTKNSGFIDKLELKKSSIDRNVSIVAKKPFVRDVVLRMQRQIINNTREGIIIDGRDIGTVVMPDADIKIFLTASVEVRALRRYDETTDMNEDQPEERFKKILKGIEERDYEDTHRKVAPLKIADDSIVVDNSSMTMDEQIEYIYEIVQEKINNE